MRFTMTSGGGLPVGSYNAKFVSVESYEENSDQYGEGVLISFEVTEGNLEGEVATRICSKKFSSKSNLYKFAKAIAGKDLQPGDSFDFDDYLDQTGMIIIEETNSGGTRVASFLASSSEKPKRSRSRK